jgi:hypothetical protein
MTVWRPRDTAPPSDENVELAKRHIGHQDLAHVVRDDRAWAARLAEVTPHFAPDFEFVVHVPGDPTVGHGFEEFRVDSWTGWSLGTPTSPTSRNSWTSGIGLSSWGTTAAESRELTVGSR